MSYTSPPTYPHLVAIIDVLEAEGIRVGDHVAPRSADGNIVTQTAVVYMGAGPIVAQDLIQSDNEALVRFRIITVDSTAQGAADLADRVAGILRANPLVVTDRFVFTVRPDTMGAVERDDDVQPPMFYSSTGYRVLSMTALEES